MVNREGMIGQPVANSEPKFVRQSSTSCSSRARSPISYLQNERRYHIHSHAGQDTRDPRFRMRGNALFKVKVARPGKGEKIKTLLLFVGEKSYEVCTVLESCNGSNLVPSHSARFLSAIPLSSVPLDWKASTIVVFQHWVICSPKQP